MKKILTVLSICVLLIIMVLLLSGCLYKVPEDPNTFTKSIMHDGLERTYRIHIPPSFNNNTSVPLVFALHGGLGTGEGMERSLTLGGFNTLSDQEGFIVVYPDGIEKHWNDGRKNVTYYAHTENIDDVGFISALIDKHVEEYNIDPERVYSTGISNGAMMSYRLACELSEKIAAIAPVAGNIPEDIVPQCSPSKPVSVLVISGTDDSLVPWDGGHVTGPFGSKKLGKVLSVNDSIHYWIDHNNCNSTPEVTWLPDTDPRDGTLVWREVYSQGNNGTEVILYGIEGGGHTWPDGLQYLSKIIIGKTCRDINANEIIWEFFEQHPMNG